MVIFGKRVVNAIWRLFGIYRPFFSTKISNFKSF